MDDDQLLREYVRDRSASAFGMLVERYVRLVHGACVRQLGDRQLAEDATQGVFVLLSMRAGRVRQARLAGWLLTAARYACANLRKSEARRVRRERVVAMLHDAMSAETDTELREFLD